ncbi:MAG: ABC transporter substrate-binding protein [Sphaerochaetaceae bacterium]|nr:ABC transporter substrate-binding protein [Sphaerochaetaceae bacterium]
MKKFTQVLSVLVLVCVLLVSCGGNKKTSATVSSAEPVKTAGTSTEAGNVKSAEISKDVKYKDTVVIGVANDITTLDPQGSNTDANMMAFYLTHERLVNVDPDTNQVIPGLAESWTVSEDGCTYVFTLPADATFTDGSKLTAADVKFTYDKAKNSSFASQKVADVKSVRVIDDTHVEVVLSKANQDWITLMAHGGMSIMSEAACTANPEKGPYLGSGMFALDEWKPGDFVSFVRYENYRKGSAPTKKIIFKLFKEASTRLIALQTGEIDVCIDPSTTDLERIKSDAKLELVQTPDVVLLYIPMQMEKPGLNNVHVRKALAYCADKEAMVLGGKDGLGTVHNNYINRGQFGLNPNIHVYEYNIEKAKEELKLSGYKPNQLTFKIMVDKEFKKTMALIFQNACAQAGINIVLDERETASLKGSLNDAALDYEMCIYQFTDDLGTDYTLRNQCGSTRQADGTLKKNGSNRPNMKDAKFNEMIDKALVETDPEKRKQMYYDAENYLDEVCPMIPICTSYINIGVKKGLAGAVWKPDAKHDYRFIAVPEN